MPPTTRRTTNGDGKGPKSLLMHGPKKAGEKSEKKRKRSGTGTEDDAGSEDQNNVNDPPEPADEMDIRDDPFGHRVPTPGVLTDENDRHDTPVPSASVAAVEGGRETVPTGGGEPPKKRARKKKTDEDAVNTFAKTEVIGTAKLGRETEEQYKLQVDQTPPSKFTDFGIYSARPVIDDADGRIRFMLGYLNFPDYFNFLDWVHEYLPDLTAWHSHQVCTRPG